MQHSLTLIAADPAGRPGIARIAFFGDVYGRDRPALEGLRRAVARTQRVRIDLEEIGYAGAAFLGWLSALCRDASARRASVHLDAVPERIVCLLVLLGLEEPFELLPDPRVCRLRLRADAAPAPLPSRPPPRAPWRPVDPAA